MIRLLIVEDQPGVRRGLKMLFATEPDLSVIGEASCGEAALDLATSLGPDVVLMDVELPCMDGIATTSELHQLQPQAKVIMLSLHDDERTRSRAKKAGAVAFVAKSMSPEMLLATIRQVAHRSGGGLILPA